MIQLLRQLRRRLRPLTEVRGEEGQIVGYYCTTCDWVLDENRKRREPVDCDLCGRRGAR